MHKNIDIDHDYPYKETVSQIIEKFQSRLTKSDRELIVQYMVLRALRSLGVADNPRSLRAPRNTKKRLSCRKTKRSHD